MKWLKIFIIKYLIRYSILKTLYVNFRVLPLKQALHLPIKIGPRVQLKGLRRGCIKIDPNDIFMFKYCLGVVAAGPMFAEKNDWSLLRLQKGSCIHFSGPGITRIGSGFSIVNEGDLYIGGDAVFNQKCFIYCKNVVEIKDFCNFGWDCQIYDSNFHFMYNKEKKSVKKTYNRVLIENNVWLGNHVTVGPSSVLPPYSTVSSFSLVNRDFSTCGSNGNIFAGTPAKLKCSGYFRIRSREFEEVLFDKFKESSDEVIAMSDQFEIDPYLKETNPGEHWTNR